MNLNWKHKKALGCLADGIVERIEGFPKGISLEVLFELEALGLIEEAIDSKDRIRGYRITQQGLAELDNESSDA